MQHGPRYAIYFAPAPDDPLWRFGSAVLGYDAALGCDVPYLPDTGFGLDEWAAWTEEPRRYGFHATLKAPFRLAPRWRPAQLVAGLQDFARRAQAPKLSGLRVAALGEFVALVPTGDTAAVANFAQSVVEAFEPFRAELTSDERQRRISSGLSDRQVQLLDRFGYPFVSEEFRFHMTLTGKLKPAHRGDVLDALTKAFARAFRPGPLFAGRLALFEQPTRRDRFRIIAAADAQT
jgi:putative phosphonate metabolism protein